MHWYAVNSKPRQENLAEQNLQRLGVETFYPQLRQNKVIRRRRQTVIGPLFPGYLFVRFNLDAQYRAVNYARGVRKLVAFGSEPVLVDDEIIESIKSRLQDGYVTIQRAPFTPGQIVRIQEGPLRGLEAIFEREMGDQERAMLLLKTLSFQARVIVDLEYVAKC
jgi:transcriptional antiterminator RfaH